MEATVENPIPPAYDSTASIESLSLSVRTYNRLRKMQISNLGQMARFTPKQFLMVDGFGRKCLYEIGEILQKFYLSLDVRRLALLANIAELWRPYFRQPDRVPYVPYDPAPLTSEVSTRHDGAAIEVFDPKCNPQSQLQVEDLPISVRARNVLNATRIKTLDDLARIGPDVLLGSENCGRGTIKELATLLGEYFTSLPISAIAFYGSTGAGWLREAKNAVSNDGRIGPTFLHPQIQTTTEVIEAALARLGNRRASILTRRMGLSQGHPRKTLEATGREFHMTRERVRQIVSAGLKLIVRKVKTCRPELYPGIRKLIRTNEIVSLEEVIAGIPELGKSAQADIKGYVRTLLFAKEDEFRPLDFGGNVWASKEITSEFQGKVLQAARQILNGIPMPCAQVSVEVAKTLRRFEDKQIKTIEKILLNSPANSEWKLPTKAIFSARLGRQVQTEGELLYMPISKNKEYQFTSKRSSRQCKTRSLHSFLTHLLEDRR